jgi:hypothetical protein
MESRGYTISAKDSKFTTATVFRSLRKWVNVCEWADQPVITKLLIASNSSGSRRNLVTLAETIHVPAAVGENSKSVVLHNHLKGK